MATGKLAKDIMSKDVVTIRPDQTCDDLQQLLLKYKISGVPVVKDNKLVGVISLFDILRKDVEIMELDDKQVNKDLLMWLRKGIISDYMSRQVQTARPDTPLEEVAATMHNSRIHRVVVLNPDDDSVAGMITTFDLLKVFARTGAIS